MILESTVKLIKNIWFLVVSIIASTSVVLVKIEEYSPIVSEYDVEIGVGLFSVLFATLFIVYNLTHRKICKVSRTMEDGFSKFEQIAHEQNKQLLMADIERFYKDNIGYKSLRRHQVQRLHYLENRRVELGLNSFSEADLKRLFEKPFDESEYRY